MKFTLQPLLLLVLPALATSLIASLLILGASELWGTEKDNSGISQVCGSAHPCVRITSGPVDRLVVGHVDFDHDSAGDVIKRIPAWFGSEARPLGLTVHNLLLKDDVPLRHQGISALSHISLVSLKEMRLDKEQLLHRAAVASK